MRRRPIILLLLAAAALTSAAIAFADAPATTLAVKALAETPDAQVGPAVAVNPAVGSPNIAAAVVGTDWRGGVLTPQSGYSSGSILAASGATTWAPEGLLPHTAADVSRGSPDVVWGPGNKVYAVEEVRDTANVSDQCQAGAGIYLFVSSNGGVSWNTPIQIVPNNGGFAFSEPSIAFDALSGHIYVAYTRTSPCTARPGAPNSQSFTRLVTLYRDDAVGGTSTSSVSGSCTTTCQFLHPSVTALPNGTAAVAYYDASGSPGRVEATICNAAAAPACGSTTDVDTSATDPAAPQSVAGVPIAVDVRPRIAADSTGRVVVAWSELTATDGMDVFSATSRDSGASFGLPVPVAPGGGPTDQIDPAIAIAPVDGRADIAFLDSRYSPSGYEVAVAASNRPTGLTAAETWSTPVAVESAPIIPVAPTSPGSATLGARIGVAEVPRATGRPWALVAWTDSRNATGGTPRNTDVYSTVLLHGATPPLATAASSGTFSVDRRVPTPVTFGATDAEADPLTYTVAQQGAHGTASIPDPNKSIFVYQAPADLVSDQVKIKVDDGVNSTIVPINVQVVNTPPVIECDGLSTPIDTALPLPFCVKDKNLDPVTLDAASPVHGTITRPGGVLTFVPEKGFAGQAQVTLTASDGTDTVVKTITITVGRAGDIVVKITGDTTRTAYIGRPILLRATAEKAGTDTSLIQWSYDDGSPNDKGPSVTHLFTKIGTYVVKAHIGDGPVATTTVLVQKPPLAITRTELGGNGAMSVRVQMASAGKLSVGLLGVHGVRQRKVKLKRGTHTVRMKLPAGALRRGTVIMKLSLAITTGGTAKLKRAVLIPPS